MPGRVKSEAPHVPTCAVSTSRWPCSPFTVHPAHDNVLTLPARQVSILLVPAAELAKREARGREAIDC